MNDISTDVLIIGAGPAGLSAALAASESGLRVMLIDDNPRAGGQIWRGGPASHLPDIARDYLQRVAQQPLITHSPATRLVMQTDDHCYLLENTAGAFQVSVPQIIICSGAREQLIPFPGWTLPGVTGAGGLQALIKSGVSVKGERVVIAGSGPLLLASAATAGREGACIVALCEQQRLSPVLHLFLRLWRWPTKLRQTAELFHPRYRLSSHVVSAHGDGKLEYVLIKQGSRTKKVQCERLACGYGLVPNTQIAQLLTLDLNGSAIAVDDDQRTSQPGIYAAGECTGVGGSELALAEGAIAGYLVAGRPEQAAPLKAQRQHWHLFARLVSETFTLSDSLKTLVTDDTIICRCEDVPFGVLKDLDGLKQARMLTRCGMGACQGKVCQTSLQYLKGWRGQQVRPPVLTARIETLCLPDEQPPY